MGADQRDQSEKMQRAVILFLLVAAATAQRKFCPGEKNGNKCQSNGDQYKCGVFFHNLRGKGEYNWLGALPDALKKTDPQKYSEILGDDVTPASFNNKIDCGPQGPTTYNSRCYSIVCITVNSIITKQTLGIDNWDISSTA